MKDKAARKGGHDLRQMMADILGIGQEMIIRMIHRHWQMPSGLP